MKPGASRWVSLAVAGLWLRLLSVLALTAFVVWRAGAGLWLTLPDLLGSAAALALWTPLIADLLHGRTVLTTDPRRRALSALYPWLIAFEAALWGLWLLNVLVGGLPEANPVAVAALVTAWGAGIVVSFLVYLLSLRLMANPADSTGFSQLADLFNLAAALAAASLIMNVVPLKGAAAPTVADQWAYGLAGAVEVVSWLLLHRALAMPESPESKKQPQT
ncbi:hypothetical protein [Deinococcus sp. UYEF24]